MLVRILNTSDRFQGYFFIAPVEIDGATDIAASGFVANSGAIIIDGRTEIGASGFVSLKLSIPEPILNELSGGFSRYNTARLLDDDNQEIKITSATIEKPRGQVGTRVSIRVAEKDLSLITAAKTYTFQIGSRETPNGEPTWHTVLEDGELESRSFSLAWGQNAPSDALEFGTTSPLAARLNRHPKETLIYYHRGRTSVETGEMEDVRTADDQAFTTSAFGYNFLTLYKILDFVRKALGFTAIETNIPNFEVTRIDFSFRNSYLQSLSGLLGVFEPIFFTVDNTLYILDKTAAIPEEFEPVAVTVAQFSNWQIQTQENPFIDGFEISYLDDSSQANAYLDRTESSSSESGTFGTSDYVRVDTTRTYRDWFHTDSPGVVLRTDFIKEVRETRKPIPPALVTLTKVGEETENHFYDAQGLRTRTEKEVYGFAPDLNGSLVHSLLLTDREAQRVFYKTDPKNARRRIQWKTETVTSGLIAVDEENPYFDENGDEAPFRQDFRRAHEAGNIKTGMTSEFGIIRTTTETYVPYGNNQYQVIEEGVDQVRNIPFRTVSEPRIGDLSVNAVGGRQRTIVVLKGGVNLSSRGTFGGVESLAVGELPLQFALTLAERKLENRIARKQTGNITIPGWSESLDRGVFFRVLDRNATSYGVFLTEGLRVDIQALGDGAIITTSVDVQEI